MDKNLIDIFNKYLLGEASANEIKEIEGWIANDEALLDWFTTDLENSPNQMDATKQALILDKIHAATEQRSQPRFRLTTWIRQAAAAALILLAAGGALLYINGRQQAPLQYAEVGALRGQKAHVVLPDGTEVTLNSESKLKYSTAFNRSDRLVELSGEAYFEVAKNKKVPFIVQVGDMEVEAVGTAFNIKGYADENYISTTLTEGEVRVTSGGVRETMLPNERMEYNVTDKSYRKITLSDASSSLGWLDDELRFENATLAEVIADLMRNYNVNIVFASENIKKQRFTGTISNNSLPSVLKIISLTSPIRFERKDSTVILYEVPAERSLFSTSKP